MSTMPTSPVPGGRPYSEPGRGYAPAADRQPVRITGTVKTKPGIWRIALGVCLGLLLYTLITAIIGLSLLLISGRDVVDEIGTRTAGAPAGTSVGPSVGGPANAQVRT